MRADRLVLCSARDSNFCFFASMKIGVVSDTHNNLKNVKEIVALFNRNQVDAVIHTGDVTRAETLEKFARLNCQLYGVFGNNDQERDALQEVIDRHDFRFSDPPLKLRLAERNIVVVHDPRDFANCLTASDDLALHGHTHLMERKTIGKTLIFNPGECAGHMKGFNAIGVVDLTSLATELLKF